MADNFNFDDEDEGGGSEWLATYGDLVTLLLCFFILLYSMSNVDSRKFKALKDSLNQIGIMDQSGRITPNVGDSIANMDALQATQEMGNIYLEVKKLIDEKGLDKQISIDNYKNGVLLRFDDELLFDSGQAVLRTNSKAFLSQMAQILKKYNKDIKIEGHTDNIPIKNNEYKSNWELSAQRAVNVVKLLTEELPKDERLDPKKFEVSGYGEHHPITSNESEKNRQKNRRIEIFIKKDKAN